MKRVEGLGLPVLLVLLPLGFLAPTTSALGPSGAGLGGVDAHADGLSGDSLLDVQADGDAHANASTDADDEALARSLLPGPGQAHAAGRIHSAGQATPQATAAAAGTAIGLGFLAILAYPFFSRIDSHRILDNGMRNRVHEAIEHNPGITIKEIVQTLGMGWGTAVYHLKRLEAERLIVSERHRQFRRFFKNGGGIANDDKGAFAELTHPTTQRLAAELMQRPGSAQKDLCTAAGISAPLASKYLGRMEQAQLLTRQREWKTVKYFPTPRLAELMGAPTPHLVLA
jgi:DNA-binding MarR family transcriptional regulator